MTAASVRDLERLRRQVVGVSRTRPHLQLHSAPSSAREVKDLLTEMPQQAGLRHFDAELRTRLSESVIQGLKD